MAQAWLDGQGFERDLVEKMVTIEFGGKVWKGHSINGHKT